MFTRIAGLSLIAAMAAAALGPLVMQMTAQTPSRAVRHVVVFKYTPEATPAQIQQVTDAFRRLATTIPGITGFEDGVNNSPEGKNQGFTHVYLMTFENEAARDTYLPHPEHRAFGQFLRSTGIFVDAFVVDYVPTTTR
jgi:hypothetical protein